MTNHYLRPTVAAFAVAVLSTIGCGDDNKAEVKSRPDNLQVEKPGAKNPAKTPGGRVGNGELSKPVNPRD